MDIKFYIDALEQIKTQNTQVQLAICQVLGALKGEQFKQQRERAEKGPLLEEKVGVGVFTEKEIFSMSKQFRKEFRANGRVAHVRKKRNGPNSWSFEIRYRRNGYNVSACATTLEECKRKFIEKLELAVGEGTTDAVVPTDFNKFAMHFFESYRKEKVVEKTYYNTLGHFRRWIEPHFAGKDIRKVTPGDCKALLDHIKAEGLGKTADEVHSLLNQTFKMAIAYNLIQRNPLAVVPHVLHEKVTGQPLTKTEEELLLAGCKDRYRIIFALYLYCGIRPGEIYSVKIDGRFVVCENIKQKDHKVHHKKIPISTKLAPYLTQELSAPKLDYIRNEFRRLLPNHTLKDCRKTFGNRCQECGVNRDVVKVWMGHVLGDVLGKHYTAFSDEFMLAEIAKIAY